MRQAWATQAHCDGRAVETIEKSKISQEQLFTKKGRKNAAAQSEHPDRAPAFALTVKIPQCGHAVKGEKSGRSSS